jgi:prophage maintenance system killer protein
MKKFENDEVIIFKSTDGEVSIDVKFDGEEIWLNRNQISDLFKRDIKTIGKHINNALKEELKHIPTVAKFATVQLEGDRQVQRIVEHYGIDMILSVGYRVKSERGIEFRRWANLILSEYLRKGYSINNKKLEVPNLSEITQLLDAYRRIDGDLTLSGNDLLQFLIAYNRGLSILDDYDHRTFETPEGIHDTYQINYSECMDIIHRSKFSGKSDNFAKERDQSFNSSISTIYQTFDGKELYPTLESKAANLLYLITKNHSFIDGNKRIASTIFLYFLDRNNALFIIGNKRINDETLAALAILIAASDPKDKELLINLTLVILG